MTTDRAHLRGISWVYRNYRYSYPLSFVLNLCPQVKERPVCMSCALITPNRYPIPYPAQFFERDRAIGVLRLSHDAFTDSMVGVFLKTSLLLRNAFKFALCGFRTIALKISAAMGKLTAIILDASTTENLAIAISGYVYDPQVDPQNTNDIDGFSFLNPACSEQIENSVNHYEIGLPNLAPEQIKLLLAALKREVQATTASPYRNPVLIDVPGKDSGIVFNCPQRLKAALNFLIQSVCLRYFCNATNNNLRRKFWKSGASILVNNFMQTKMPKLFLFPGYTRNPIAARVSALHCELKRISLLGICDKFYFRSKLHINSVIQSVEIVKEGSIQMIERVVTTINLLRGVV